MPNVTNKYIKHIEETLINLAPNKYSYELEKLAAYIGTKHKVLGFETAVVREIVKHNTAQIILPKTNEELNLVYTTSNVFEVKNLSLYHLDKNFETFLDSGGYAILIDWINYTDNWAHSDHLSKFYTQLLVLPKHKTVFLNELKQWNKDENLWKRRQSLVALFYYARCKKEFIPYEKVEKLISNLIKDKEYFVQKGLGWTLRESFSVYPKETYAFILKNAGSISPTAFTAAVEKMSTNQKEVLKLKRKKLRIKK